MVIGLLSFSVVVVVIIVESNAGRSQGRRKHFRIGMAKIIPCHGLTMEGPKVPSEAREARSAGAPRGWGLGLSLIHI